MRLRLFRGRIWRSWRALRGRPSGRADVPARASQPDPQSSRPAGPPASHRKTGHPPVKSAPAHAGPASGNRLVAAGRAHAAARVAIRTTPKDAARSDSASRPDAAGNEVRADYAVKARDTQPWYATVRSATSAAGYRNCGRLEEVLVREWAADEEPVAQVITAINRLAALPRLIKEKLAAGLDAIHVGPGGVPDLDHMGELAGVPLPSGRATWDACAGAYGDRKIVVGSRPSPTPDVMCHEVGHALDDIDGPADGWQSDSADFREVYSRCAPHLASEFHQHGGALGRREFFADAFAAIASSQRPALVEMLSGDTRTALDVMLYFNVRYGI